MRQSKRFTIITFVFGVLLTCGCSRGDDDDASPTIDDVSPTIAASVSPEANAAGWHNVNTTVTFKCADNTSIIFCSEPVLVDMEGDNQVVTGTAVDGAGNRNSVSVTLNLDKTSPVLSNYLPSDGDTLPDPEINLVGKVADPLSDVAKVVCDANGTLHEAVINKGTVDDDYVFACSMPLILGPNVITVDSNDISGNVTSSFLTIHHALPPKIAIDSPNEGEIIILSPTIVTGTIDDASATVIVNNTTASVSNGVFTASVPVENGVNTITAVAQNFAGSGIASVDVLAIVGLNPTVVISLPNSNFVLGGIHDKNFPLTVEGWVRDNRVIGIGPAPVVNVWFNNTIIAATVTKQKTGFCDHDYRCWRYIATMDVEKPNAIQLSIKVEARTGDLTASKEKSGIVDFCYKNNGGAINDDACAASLYQQGGRQQSRRCIENSDGCSAPLGALKDNPVNGILGLTSTAFGINEEPVDADKAKDTFTVFGQKRPSQLPCNRHDECYHQWSPQSRHTISGVVAEKTQCNARFYEDMRAVCQKAYPEVYCPADRIGLLNCPFWHNEKSRCYAWARIYWDSVDADTARYLFPGPYAKWPYGGYLTPSEGCPVIP